MGSWLLWALLFVLQFQENHSNDTVFGLPVPQSVKLDIDWKSQRISVSWELSPLTHNLSEGLLFDIQVLQNEDVVHNDTMESHLKSFLKRVHRWKWNSPITLECPPQSFRVRTRLLNFTSQWSPKLTVDETDVPSDSPVQVFPEKRVARVGATVRFCCILGKGHALSYAMYNNEIVAAAPVSNQRYIIILQHLTPTKDSGNDVVCTDTSDHIHGATLFVGYPPGDHNLVCETDLASVECKWDPGQMTHLLGDRRTQYTLNRRNCTVTEDPSIRCNLSEPLGERSWILTATNPLSSVVLTDRVDLNHRVRMQAPLAVTSPEVHAGNVSIRWSWRVKAYGALPLLCQVQLTHSGLVDTRNYTGWGLSGLELTGLQPDTGYTLWVRCGTQHNFWKWSNWGSYGFKTKEDRPDALDVWMHVLSSHSAHVMWKPLSASESHGQIRGYQVTWHSSTGRQSSQVSPERYSFYLSDLGDGVATVTAFNSAGSSPPSSIGFSRVSGWPVSVSKISGVDGGFNLSWPAGANVTCGYAVEWFPTHSADGSTVEWVKVPAQHTWARIPPGQKLTAGLKYSLSVYSCNQGMLELLDKREGYAEEMAPGEPVQNLTANPVGSEVHLLWDGVPPEGQRGFIRGYSVYLFTPSGLNSTENITDPDARRYTKRNLPPGNYAFTVKAYTSAGEGVGDTVSTALNPPPDLPIFGTSISLGATACFLILTTVICYWNRKWMKEKLYPDIPQPKLSPNWATSPMLSSQTLDLMKCPDDRVEIMSHLSENSGTDLGEEKGGDGYPPDTDSSCHPHLRYYQQASGRTCHRCITSVPPAVSIGTNSTEITYTAVQTPLTATQDVLPTVGYRPQISAAQLAGPLSPLPLLEDMDYQPHPSCRPSSLVIGSLDQPLDTPTSGSSFTFLLGGAQQTSPVELHGLPLDRNYTNPTYLSTDTAQKCPCVEQDTSPSF